jgi:diguanylate cyclase (GGDEF)-like protein/PAS domain S-box-containing protein
MGVANVFPFDYENEPCLLIGWADISESRLVEDELKNYRTQLENLVKERTTELSYTNEVLMGEMSERKLMEQSQRASAEELRILLGALTDVIMVINSEGRYCRIAPTNPERHFRPPEFLLGKTFHEVLPVETANMFLNYVRQTLDTKRSVNTEYPMLMGNSQVWFSAILSPLTDDQVIWVARDITYLKQTETTLRQYQEQLEELVQARTNELALANSKLLEEITEHTRTELELRVSEERYQMIVEEQTDLICHWTPDANLTFVNNPFCQYFGGTKEQFIGESLLKFLPFENQKTTKEILQQLLVKKTAISKEERMTLPDGEVRWLLWSYQQIYGENDDLIEIQAVGRDITDRKRAEIAENEQRMLAETLRAANLSLTQSLDLKTICERLLDYLELTISCDSATIFILEGENHLTAFAVRGYDRSGYPNPGEALNVTFIAEPGTNLYNLIQKQGVMNIPDISLNEEWIYTETSSHICSWLGVPMVVGEKVIGVCSLDSTQRNFFTSEHIEIVKALGAQAAFAIQNAHLFETTQKYARETESLQKIMLAVSTSLNFNQVTNILLDQIGVILPSDSASIILVDGQDMVLTAFRGPNAGEITLGSRWPKSRSPLEQAIKEQRPIHFPDVQAEYEIFREPPHNIIRSVLVTPLILKGEVIGVINLDSWTLNHFSKDDERLAALFASQVTIAIENAHLYEASQRQLKEQSILNEINHIVTSTLDLDELMEFTYQQIHRFIISRLFMIAKYDLHNDEWVSLLLKRDGVNMPPISHKSSEGLSGFVIQSRKPLFLRNSSETNDFCRKTNRISLFSTAKSDMLVPLIIKDKVIGVMGAQNDDIEEAFSKQDFDLFCSISTQIAVAFENAILYAEMEKLAITDSLTGLFNRRHFFMLASNEFERAVRYDKPLSAIMIDFDHFKKVNDAHGHSVGDQVLQEVARLCEQGLRKIDIIGRYGGEEFVIVLPETSIQSAREAAERLRCIISEAIINTSKGILQISISLGVAKMDASHSNLEALLDCADQALFVAKQEGRNQVKVYQLIEE